MCREERTWCACQFCACPGEAIRQFCGTYTYKRICRQKCTYDFPISLGVLCTGCQAGFHHVQSIDSSTGLPTMASKAPRLRPLGWDRITSDDAICDQKPQRVPAPKIRSCSGTPARSEGSNYVRSLASTQAQGMLARGRAQTPRSAAASTALNHGSPHVFHSVKDDLREVNFEEFNVPAASSALNLGVAQTINSVDDILPEINFGATMSMELNNGSLQISNSVKDDMPEIDFEWWDAAIAKVPDEMARPTAEIDDDGASSDADGDDDDLGAMAVVKAQEVPRYTTARKKPFMSTAPKNSAKPTDLESQHSEDETDKDSDSDDQSTDGEYKLPPHLRGKRTQQLAAPKSRPKRQSAKKPESDAQKPDSDSELSELSDADSGDNEQAQRIPKSIEDPIQCDPESARTKPAPEKKRGPGRPGKVEIEKRGPGRPRKENTRTTEQRRGPRPRKAIVEKSSELVSSGAVAKKRGPGRPRTETIESVKQLVGSGSVGKRRNPGRRARA